MEVGLSPIITGGIVNPSGYPITNQTPTEELDTRLPAEADVFGGTLPQRYQIAWGAYLVAVWVSSRMRDADYERLRTRFTPDGYIPPDLHPHTSAAIRTAFFADRMQAQTRLRTTMTTMTADQREPYTLAWWGYLAGLFDQGMLAWGTYFTLIEVFPAIVQPDPISDIFRGRHHGDTYHAPLLNDLASADPPEVGRCSLAWRAFLMAEWQYGRLTPAGYHRLVALLPTVPDRQALASLSVARGTHPEFRAPNLIESLEEQIDQITRVFHGDLPESYAIVWRAYVLGIREAIFYREDDHYYQLVDRLPPLHDPNPLAGIFKAIA